MAKKKKPVVFLRGKRLYLRPLEATDIDRCQRWINDADARQFICQQFPMDSESQRKWHESRDRGNPRTDIIFAVVLNADDRHIGNMGLHDINWINREGTTGALIGEQDCRSKGYGHEAK